MVIQVNSSGPAPPAALAKARAFARAPRVQATLCCLALVLWMRAEYGLGTKCAGRITQVGAGRHDRRGRQRGLAKPRPHFRIEISDSALSSTRRSRVSSVMARVRRWLCQAVARVTAAHALSFPANPRDPTPIRDNDHSHRLSPGHPFFRIGASRTGRVPS